jgi:hypothetical protein
MKLDNNERKEGPVEFSPACFLHSLTKACVPPHHIPARVFTYFPNVFFFFFPNIALLFFDPLLFSPGEGAEFRALGMFFMNIRLKWPPANICIGSQTGDGSAFQCRIVDLWRTIDDSTDITCKL